MTKRQKAALSLGAALVGVYVLKNVARDQARTLGLSPAQLAVLTAGVAIALDIV